VTLRLFRDINREPAPPWFRRLAPILHAALSLLIRRDWDKFPALPSTGPAILVFNHLSSFDAVVVADYVLYHGRYPYFLAKDSLFNVPVLKHLMRAIDQIPVYRGTDQAGDALAEAKHRLAQGKIVVIFMEGTTCRDPKLWPFAAKTGAARLAIDTGVPVIPVGQWGVSTLCPDNAGPQRAPEPVPRPWVHFRGGRPVDLSAFGRDATDRAAVRGATTTILDALVRQVEVARGKKAPPKRWNPDTQSYVDPAEAIW